MSEYVIQNALWRYAVFNKKHKAAAPNISIFSGESDFISVTNSNISHEYEIKISRSDFAKDLLKERHKILLSAVNAALQEKRFRMLIKPNYFWYVVPHGLITAQETPDYAGLIYAIKPSSAELSAQEYTSVQIIKKAPIIHKAKMSKNKLENIYRASMFRYWRARDDNEKLRIQIQDIKQNANA